MDDDAKKVNEMLRSGGTTLFPGIGRSGPLELRIRRYEKATGKPGDVSIPGEGSEPDMDAGSPDGVQEPALV